MREERMEKKERRVEMEIERKDSQSLRLTRHLPFPNNEVSVELLVDFFPVLVLHRLQDRASSEILKDVGGDVETENGWEGAENGKDPNLRTRMRKKRVRRRDLVSEKRLFAIDGGRRGEKDASR